MVLRHCALTEEPKDDNPCWDISIKWSDWWWEWTSTICWMKTRFLWYLSRSSLAVPFSLELALKVKWSSMMIRLPLLKGHLFFSGRRSRDVSDGEDDDFVRSMSAFDACWKSSNTFGSSSLEREARGEFMILPVVFVFIKEAEGVASFMLLLFISFFSLVLFFLADIVLRDWSACSWDDPDGVVFVSVNNFLFCARVMIIPAPVSTTPPALACLVFFF